jgi:Ca2+-transporting ATPase
VTAASLFASTVVTRGVGVAQVCATGARTAVGRIGADLAATTEPPSALQEGSRRWCAAGHRCRGAGDGPGAAGLVVERPAAAGQPALRHCPGHGLLPEEIPVILTVFLALGAWRIAQKVLTRRITAVEMGAITVLAVDKTGTLTLNRMAVAELATPEQHFRPEGPAICPRTSTGWPSSPCWPRRATRSTPWKRPSSSSATSGWKAPSMCTTGASRCSSTPSRARSWP